MSGHTVDSAGASSSELRSELRVGSVVRLKDPEGWIQPYRRWGKERPATITAFSVDGDIKIIFKMRRPASRTHSMWVSLNDVIADDTSLPELPK